MFTLQGDHNTAFLDYSLFVKMTYDLLSESE